MASVLVFGYGNTLRGDDGIGWRVAEVLSSAGLSPEIEVVTLHQLGPELAERIARAGTVIFVDATVHGEPGEVRFREITPDTTESGFTHQFTPPSLLELAKEMYGRVPRAYVVSICGGSFDLSETLSPRIEAVFSDVVRLVGEKAVEAMQNAECRMQKERHAAR